MTTKQPPVILLPGFMASLMYDRLAGKTLWGPVPLVQQQVAALRLDATGRRDADLATEVIATVPFGIVYEPLLDQLRGDGHQPAIGYGFDFRRSLSQLADHLIAYVRDLATLPALQDGPRTGADNPALQFIGHSTGCLVIRLALERGLEAYCDRAVFIAPPWQGTVLALDAMQDVPELPGGLNALARVLLGNEPDDLRATARTFWSLPSMVPGAPATLEPALWEEPLSSAQIADATAVREVLARPLPPEIAERCLSIGGDGDDQTLWPTDATDRPIAQWQYDTVPGDGYIPVHTLSHAGTPVWTLQLKGGMDAFEWRHPLNSLTRRLLRHGFAMHGCLPLYPALQQRVREFLGE